MNERVSAWWLGRTQREQRLLMVMAALLAVVLAWLLIVRPLGDALSEARERHGAAVVALAEARAQAGAIAGLERAPPTEMTESLDAAISRSATEAGFPVTRLEREGAGQATVTIEAARPQAFFAWVERLEATGLVVERLSAASNSDQTLSVKVTWRARSRT